MAYATTQTIEDLDAKAAALAAERPAPAEEPAEITLAYGAKGENVTKLVNLLAVLDYATNSVVRGGEPLLDESVLVDVRAAQGALEVLEEPIEGVEGELVGAKTWSALYDAAAAKLSATGDGEEHQASA